jgi:hypothetical protein
LRGSALLWWDMQTGKTRAVLNAFDRLWQTHPSIRHLIAFCPAYARATWQTEIEKMGLGLPVMTAYGITRQRIEPAELSESIGFTSLPRVTICSWDVADAWAPRLLRPASGQVLILDESHEHAVNPVTKRYRAVRKLTEIADRTWALTGTIYKKTAMDVYWQGRLIRAFRGVTPLQFGEKYCIRKFNPYHGYHGAYEFSGLKKGVEEDLVNLIPNLSRVHEEDCFDIPAVRRIDRWVDVGPAYKGGDNETNMERARSGLVGLKVKRTLEFLADLPQRPVVVYGWHREFVETLAAQIPGSAFVTGDTGFVQRAQIQRDFALGRIPVLVANLKAFGLSVSLAKASHMIFGEIHWSETDHRQAEGRIKGVAQTARHIDYTYLMVKNSVEDYVWRTKLNKGKAMDRLDLAISKGLTNPEARINVSRGTG